MADLQSIVQSARRLQSYIDKLSVAQSYAKIAMPKPVDFVELYDALVKSEELRSVSRGLFADGYYARAVEEAYKCINNTVKIKSGLSADGQDLMNQAFSPKNPVLKINKLKTDSEKNQQLAG